MTHWGGGGIWLRQLKVHVAVLVVVVAVRLTSTGVCGVPSQSGMPEMVSVNVTVPLWPVTALEDVSVATNVW